MSSKRTLLLAAALALASPAAHAGPHSGVDAQLYKPSMDAFGIWTLDAATGLKKYDFSFKLGVGFGSDPLRVAIPGIGDPVDNGSSDSALNFALGLNMTAAFGFTDRLSIGLDVGIVRTDTDDGYGERGDYRDSGSDPSTGLISLRPLSNIDPSGGFEPQGQAVPTDVRVTAKYRLGSGKSDLRLALVGIVSVPFGDEEMFLGDRSFVLEPKLVVEYGLGENSRLVANVGARLRERTVLEAYSATLSQTPDDAQIVLDVGSEAVAGVGILMELAPQLLLGAEASVFVPLPQSLNLGRCVRSTGTPCDKIKDEMFFDPDMAGGDLAALALLGLNYRATPDTTLSASGGTGALLGDGRGDTFRVMAGVSWSPTPEGTRVIGRGDADGDGVPDRIDICPDEPEDNDGYQDDDGCPDLDNDGDGVIDAQDACPDEPEDRDGYKDDDGCPERDNDGDGVSDVTDRCPNDPEDLDKFEDDDGCPDEDNDGDGIADAKDKCPNEAETVNGVDDLDGCPDDEIAGGVQMDPGQISTQGAKFKFASDKGKNIAKLTATDKLILDDVATLLNDAQWATVQIRIEVHVALGTKSKNKGVIKRQGTKDAAGAGKRADAVRNYLISKGVSAGRLQAVGIGSARPLTQPATDPTNERIDFIRTEQR